MVFDEAHHSPAPTFRKLLQNLGADACAEGAYCQVAGTALTGTCQALAPKCADPRSCYRDTDCAEPGARCYGADEIKNVLGACRQMPALPSCIHDRDCPYDFACEGETLGCADPAPAKAPASRGPARPVRQDHRLQRPQPLGEPERQD